MFRHFMKDFLEEPQTKEKPREERVGAQALHLAHIAVDVGAGWCVLSFLEHHREVRKHTTATSSECYKVILPETTMLWLGGEVLNTTILRKDISSCPSPVPSLNFVQPDGSESKRWDGAMSIRAQASCCLHRHIVLVYEGT